MRSHQPLHFRRPGARTRRASPAHRFPGRPGSPPRPRRSAAAGSPRAGARSAKSGRLVTSSASHSGSRGARVRQHLGQHAAAVADGLVERVDHHHEAVPAPPAIDAGAQRLDQQPIEQVGRRLAGQLRAVGIVQPQPVEQQAAVVVQPGGELEGEGAQHARRVAPVVNIVAAEAQADHVGSAAMRRPAPRRRSCPSRAPRSARTAATRPRPSRQASSRSSSQSAADEAADQRVDVGRLRHRAQAAGQLLDLAAELGGGRAGQQAKDVVELAAIPGLVERRGRRLRAPPSRACPGAGCGAA